ncbi:hypothetical protein Bhyg_09149 [Pseudolycoriella hygida]|uniref:Uncharacterized protein n=1 Tax=Pseudolycoriella hygida TaxID=35572 RepID=A0A9Q0N601_9DIPT|nr:hypothetical protein Bhyg_09149 [Pseudolycoriella hygida]
MRLPEVSIMVFLRPLQFVVLCCFCVLANAITVELGGFTTIYGLTGCLTEPTEGCGRGGSDVCYRDRDNNYAITGTAPLCSACMPKNFRNIATYAEPIGLPCALWRAYGCDDYFVSLVWERSGSNPCFLGGEKSYNIENTFSTAQDAQNEFVSHCTQFKYSANPQDKPTNFITEEQFCFPVVQNITDIRVRDADGKVTVLTNYKGYFESKYNITTLPKP